MASRYNDLNEQLLIASFASEGVTVAPAGVNLWDVKRGGKVGRIAIDGRLMDIHRDQHGLVEGEVRRILEAMADG